ncbi:hypothetical protein [Rubripirellula tenax]|nr:hypothetical protein [Rubripirellula tenax]
MSATAKTEKRIANRSWQQVLAATLCVSLCLGLASDAIAYTPEDPVVQQMINKGVKFLEGLDTKGMSHAGSPMLMGYTHHKCRHDPDAAIVKQGIAAAKRYVGKAQESGRLDHTGMYDLAVCVLLFAEVDPVGYRDELVLAQKLLLDSQMPGGGFGYPGDKMGDVSQVQYVSLAMWTLDRNGIPLNYEKVVSCLQWILRVQDTQGAWPYHGVDPGPGKPNIAQTNRVGISMGLAGGSSTLILGDALRLWGDTTSDENDPGIAGLPKAIKLFVEDSNQNRRKTAKISKEPIFSSIGYLESWRAKNPYKRSGLDWYYYILYTLERYESFVEIARGLPKDSSPDWYNRYVDELKGFQDADGGWKDRSHTQAPESTCFALLFLIRSTQKTIFSLSAGSLEGGYGLPKDTTNIRVDGTQIKGKAIATQVTDLLKILESDGAGDTEGKSLPDDLELDPTPAGRRAQIDRLERLLRGSRSWQARRVAAKLLGKSDELRVAPSLIFALSDNDKPTRRFARDGLRFISRKFEGFGMPDDPSEAEIDKAQREWRDWYRSTDPTYVFLDYDL